MNKVISFFFSFIVVFFCSINSHAQADSIVSVTVNASLVNDSTYSLKGKLILQKSWHVYGNNADGLNAPLFQFALETIKGIGTPTYSVQPNKQKDILFT
ncbi:MAG: hypothetical protein RL064_115, partial [Bacteroidota bacterium]